MARGVVLFISTTSFCLDRQEETSHGGVEEEEEEEDKRQLFFLLVEATKEGRKNAILLPPPLLVLFSWQCKRKFATFLWVVTRKKKSFIGESCPSLQHLFSLSTSPLPLSLAEFLLLHSPACKVD